MKLNMLSLFSGIGAFEKALENIGIKINLKNFCEIDKYASQAYCAIHKVDKKLNLNDITEIDIEKLPTSGIDIITHGSPCQDFSMAGLQAGGDIGTGTRSSLMWNSVAIIKHVKPKFVVWENVKNVLSKKHKHNFEKYLKSLEDIGYNNYYQVLNAKDYGIPQNRERIFVVSIRKDIDKGNFNFPEKQTLQLKLKDLLDDEVDEKFYLKDSQIERIKNSTFMQEKKRIQDKEYCDTLLARDWKDPKCIRVGGLYDSEGKTHQAGSIYNKNGLAPTLNTMNGGNRQPLITEDIKLKGAYGRNYGSKGKIEDEVCSTLQAAMGNGGGNIPLVKEDSYISKKYENFYNDKGYIPEMFNPYNENEIQDIAPTQTANCGGITSSATILKREDNNKIKVIGNYMPSGHDASRVVDSNGIAPTVKENHGTITATNVDFKIRKLTPKECWRLMGFSDEDFQKAQDTGLSNTQLYKQAGNSIVVNVLEEIFKNLFLD